MNVAIERAHMQRIAAQVREECPDDETLLLDCLEGETNLFEIVQRLLDLAETDEGNEAALAQQIAQRRFRLEAARARQARARAIISDLMEATGINRVTLPEATVSRRTGKASLLVCDEDAIPDEFTIISRRIDKRKLNDAYADQELPNWLAWEAPSPTITVRRK